MTGGTLDRAFAGFGDLAVFLHALAHFALVTVNAVVMIGNLGGQFLAIGILWIFGIAFLAQVAGNAERNIFLITFIPGVEREFLIGVMADHAIGKAVVLVVIVRNRPPFLALSGWEGIFRGHFLFVALRQSIIQQRRGINRQCHGKTNKNQKFQFHFDFS